MLKIQLDELLKLLQKCTILEELEKEMLVQLAQEELDKQRSLAEDELDENPAEDKILVYTTCRTD